MQYNSGDIFRCIAQKTRIALMLKDSESCFEYIILASSKEDYDEGHIYKFNGDKRQVDSLRESFSRSYELLYEI